MVEKEERRKDKGRKTRLTSNALINVETVLLGINYRFRDSYFHSVFSISISLRSLLTVRKNIIIPFVETSSIVENELHANGCTLITR